MGADAVEEGEVLGIYPVTPKIVGGQSNKWIAKLKLAGCDTPFLIDTGAKCTVITLACYQNLRHSGELHKSARVLHTFFNNYIYPLAAVQLKAEHKQLSFSTEFDIVDINQENILCGRTYEDLGLVMRLDTVESKKLPDLDEFPDIVHTTGTLPGTYTIKLEPGAKGVIHSVRRQPAALKQRIVEKLEEMVKEGYITRVDQPTEWVNSMVVSLRKDKIRICLDPSDLNRAIKREHHPMKTIEEVVASMPNAKVFSVLDAKSGFLQVKLDDDSSLLTTFNSPIGRFRWLRLPFGIRCAPEIFQRIMDQMLEGITGATSIMDDIIVAGRDVTEHDQVLHKVTERVTQYNLKLNAKKCQIRKAEVPYVGHLLTAEGLKPDPEKVEAVRNMPAPSDKEGVKCFLGFITYLSKFFPNLSTEDKPLCQHLKSDTEFEWQPAQETAFQKLKDLCCQAVTLRYYDVSKPIELHCDASKEGLGAVLIQEDRPVAYTSRALSDTETRYAQIEKEMLSIVHGCTKFHCLHLRQRNNCVQ